MVSPRGTLGGREFWLDGAIRETQEEVGIQVNQAILCGIYSDPKLTVTQDVLFPENYHGQFVVALFKVLSYEGKINPNNEVDDWDWFSPDNLPDPMLKSHPIRAVDAFHFNGKVFVR
ncbi:NUDIX hydrolase [bacterium]|nr:NUDIX hydrolase [bacterium]